MIKIISNTHQTIDKKTKGEKNFYQSYRREIRERILKNVRCLSNYEILECILYSSGYKADAKSTSKILIDHFCSFSKIFNAKKEDLKEVTGINDAAIAAIFCVKEALEIILKEEIKELPIINNWKKLVEYLKISIGGKNIENFHILYLNKKNHLIAEDLQDVGTIDQTHIYIREIIKKSLVLGAASIIISHNHPSGDTKPSNADLILTKQISQACISIGIKLIDHVIISRKNHYSFRTNGFL